MKNVILVLMYIVLLFGCATLDKPREFCRHRALYNAYLYGEKYPVRILLGKMDTGVWHSYVQYYKDSKWRNVEKFRGEYRFDLKYIMTFREYMLYILHQEENKEKISYDKIW